MGERELQKSKKKNVMINYDMKKKESNLHMENEGEKETYEENLFLLIIQRLIKT